jgi:hypothetical protein
MNTADSACPQNGDPDHVSPVAICGYRQIGIDIPA